MNLNLYSNRPSVHVHGKCAGVQAHACCELTQCHVKFDPCRNADHHISHRKVLCDITQLWTSSVNFNKMQRKPQDFELFHAFWMLEEEQSVTQSGYGRCIGTWNSQNRQGMEDRCHGCMEALPSVSPLPCSSKTVHFRADPWSYDVPPHD